MIKWQDWPAPATPVSYRVTAVVGGTAIPFGGYLQAATSRGGTSSISEQAEVKFLATDVTSMDLQFVPDPTNAERIIGIDRIWGQPFEIKNVPLARYDLPSSTRPAGP